MEKETTGTGQESREDEARREQDDTGGRENGTHDGTDHEPGSMATPSEVDAEQEDHQPAAEQGPVLEEGDFKREGGGEFWKYSKMRRRITMDMPYLSQ